MARAARTRRDIPDSLPRRAYLGLVQLQGALAADYEALFRSRGLSATRFNVLRVLVQGPAEGLPCHAIRAGLVHRVPDVTRLLDRMERDGLVERGRSEDDRRVVLVSVTTAGRRLCESLYRPVAALHRRHFAGLSRNEIERLDRLARKALAHHEPVPEDELP